jgi:hypothetical protein
MRLKRALYAIDAGFRGLFKRVLPDANNFPAFVSELAVHFFIAGYIVGALFVPKCAVSFGARVALGTSMPETAIDKDGNSLLVEDKIRLS